MASVALNFRPPMEPGIVTLKIYEAPASSGPWTLIETVNLAAIGAVYPDYITRHTTDDAVSAVDWFSIEWIDGAGASSGQSAPVKGGTENLVSVITERVLLRDPSLDENVVAQEAEAVIEKLFPGRVVRDVQPDEATFQMLSGMTLMTMAASYIQVFLSESSSSVDDFTAGLVSMKSGSASSKKDLKSIKDIVALANSILGMSYSVKLLIEEAVVGGGFKQLQGVDLTRLLLEVE